MDDNLQRCLATVHKLAEFLEQSDIKPADGTIAMVMLYGMSCKLQGLANVTIRKNAAGLLTDEILDGYTVMGSDA